MVIITSYTATLASALTVTSFRPGIEGPESIGSYHFPNDTLLTHQKVCVVPGRSSHKEWSNEGETFRNKWVARA